MPEPPQIPTVTVAFPAGRPAQLRYVCPVRLREVRVSTGTRDPADVERQRAKLQAQLTLGQAPTPRRRRKRTADAYGPHMAWEDFRELYRVRHLAEQRPKTRSTTESRLNVAAKFIRPGTLADMATREHLVALRQHLIDAHESLHGAKSHLATILGVLHWAESEGLLERVPPIPRIKTARLKSMKGRPITGEEFERMLAKAPDVVGAEAAASWTYTLRGLWTSALRIGELLMVAWDLPETITPHWPRRRKPVLQIPACLQKNNTEEAIPLLPWFDAVLRETPESDRRGWVFRPASLNLMLGRKARGGSERPSAEWASKVITRIGEAAGVIVEPAKPTGDPEKPGQPKYASAHDLRRSCAERLVEAGVPEQVVMRVLRHQSWETTRRHYAPGQVQREAEQLHELLGVE